MRVGDAVLGLMSLLLGALVLWHVRGFPEVPGHYFGPGLFPSAIAAGFVLAGVLLMVRGARRRRAAPDPDGQPAAARTGAHGMAGAALAVGAILAFIFLGETVGFQLLALATLSAFYLWAGRRWLEILLLPLLLTLALDLLFGRLLRVPLPAGWLSGHLFW
ncbi:tripartite tricarboxylate transporter TctB family protein [Orrella sp. JC864]|uniref:tripartite tricarboxylate transporter TctB family protein n=1 Tax=Orrella sp. JC864 TaxID=3120298 RepID=UPI0012BB8213